MWHLQVQPFPLSSLYFYVVTFLTPLPSFDLLDAFLVHSYIFFFRYAEWEVRRIFSIATSVVGFFGHFLWVNWLEFYFFSHWILEMFLHPFRLLLFKTDGELPQLCGEGNAPQLSCLFWGEFQNMEFWCSYT